MNTIKIKFSLIFLILLICNGLIAQEDNKSINEDTVKAIPSQNNTQIVRIRKSYTLGDGLTFRAPGMSLLFEQSFQVLCNVNTPDNFSTMKSYFNIRRARFAMTGSFFNDKINFKMRFNLPGNYQSNTTGLRSYNGVMQEGYVEYNFNKENTLSFGLRADYIDSREIRIEGENLGYIERSAVSLAYDAIFDYGLRYKGSFHLAGRNVIHPYLSITTGDGNPGLQKNYGGYKYGVRLDYLPFGEFSKGGEYYMDDLARESRPKLVLGFVYSYNTSATSATGATGGRYLYGDVNKSILLPSFSKYNFDYLFKYKGFYSMGSLIATKATVPDGIAGEFKLSGSFTAYTNQTPDQIKATVLSRLNLGSGFNFQAGYLFHSNWAFGGRYSYLNDDVQSANFAYQNRFYTFVASKYLSEHNLKIQSELGYQELKQSLQTSSQKGNLYATVMLTVQL